VINKILSPLKALSNMGIGYIKHSGLGLYVSSLAALIFYASCKKVVVQDSYILL